MCLSTERPEELLYAVELLPYGEADPRAGAQVSTSTRPRQSQTPHHKEDMVRKFFRVAKLDGRTH